MFQVGVLMQQLAQLLSCSRRNPSGNRAGFKESPSFASGKYSKKAASRGYRSNESTDLDSDAGLLSTSGSEDKETTSSRHSAQRSSIARPPGLRGPPGLERPRGGQSAYKKLGSSGEGKGFYSEAGAIVRKPLNEDRYLSECLREVTSSSGNDVPSSLEEVLKRRLEREKNGPPGASLPVSLQQVLGKLTPGDAAIVKAAFQSKQASSNAPRFPRSANVTDDNTLKVNLQKLATIDSKRVFMVRKISRLGLNSADVLRKYFSTFGSIEHVFVTHGIDKRKADLDLPHPQIRPAGMGFIVMERVEDVAYIFKQGLEHNVKGVEIALTAYEHHDPQGTAPDESKVGFPLSSDSTSKPPGPRYPSYANISEENTLRSNLRKLAEIDADRIFMVRKINKLGLGSAQLLKTYFGQFGGVTNAFVTHSLDRRKFVQENPKSRPAVRPAGIGFVVMDEAGDVLNILQAGLEHTVYGVKVRVATYEHQAPDEADDQDKDNGSEAPTNESEVTC